MILDIAGDRMMNILFTDFDGSRSTRQFSDDFGKKGFIQTPFEFFIETNNEHCLNNIDDTLITD